ncbi:MAG TPA: YdiU family protein [Steroidobacteraceae bacterium]
MNLENDYSRLSGTLYTRLDPVPVAAPRLIKFNEALATELRLELNSSDPEHLARIFSGNEKLPGSQPIALAYAGHQFGSFVPRLGDGRAVLLGEARDQSGILKDIQLKGAGRTAYSRGGDGRAALGPVLREYLVSEAMTAMGIPSTRSLAAVWTGERVRRGPASLPGAILTRVASSHVRVGTFQYLAAQGDTPTLRSLADYVIDRYYPEARISDTPYRRLLDLVVDRQAALIAQWMKVGFIHGVMNTDNTSVVGETIDYGPCAFMDAYDPQAVFSSIDQNGRYSFSNQPAIAQWNLARFAETLLPLFDAEQDQSIALATESINAYSAKFEQEWLRAMRSKVGLLQAQPEDEDLINALLDVMHRTQADYTVTFWGLSAYLAGNRSGLGVVGALRDHADFQVWLRRWEERGAQESESSAVRFDTMRRANPRYIPRNHRIEEVIEAATTEEDFAPFEALLEVIVQPFDEQPSAAGYAAPPRPDQRVVETFCGT